ncbi:hypothetical protein E2C01_023221 [Portunus trituberculatus]|uniref:Uncharacterized protein n=1 Tax=Portunus trituberculatus TaxID=210409 RepID=A0A5B7E9E1_PORTR|nr:hypothetical protein [Portunus trituberculatus]
MISNPAPLKLSEEFPGARCRRRLVEMKVVVVESFNGCGSYRCQRSGFIKARRPEIQSTLPRPCSCPRPRMTSWTLGDHAAEEDQAKCSRGKVRWPMVSGRRFQSRLAIQSQRMFPRHDQRPREVNKADGEEGSAAVPRDTH